MSDERWTMILNEFGAVDDYLKSNTLKWVFRECRELIGVVILIFFSFFLLLLLNRKNIYTNIWDKYKKINCIWRFWLWNEPKPANRWKKKIRNKTHSIRQCVLLFSKNSFKCYLRRPFYSFWFYFVCSHFHFHEYSMQLSQLCSSCACGAFFLQWTYLRMWTHYSFLP